MRRYFLKAFALASFAAWCCVSPVAAIASDVSASQRMAVTAIVPEMISFSIRDASDVMGAENCGTERTACAYRLRITTNAARGFVGMVDSSEKDARGFSAIAMRVTVASAGGRNVSGTAFDQPATKDVDAVSDVSVVPAEQTPLVSFPHQFSAPAGALDNSTLVEHSAIAGDGPQVVTYMVTGMF